MRGREGGREGGSEGRRQEDEGSCEGSWWRDACASCWIAITREGLEDSICWTIELHCP